MNTNTQSVKYALILDGIIEDSDYMDEKEAQRLNEILRNTGHDDRWVVFRPEWINED